VVGEQFHETQGKNPENDPLLRNLPLDDPIRKQIVRIDRYVANEEVGSYFSVADVLVTPYLSVTQSGPLQVAYAFDKPVIASDLPAFRECVSHGESGYLFSTGDARDLEDKMELFMNQPVDSGQVRQYRWRFSWERYIELMLDSQQTRFK
jgi:glycosyltransferase involved in cell wall biosynthesis